MLSLATPLWLLGLLLLPAIRWLHRGGRHRRALAVAHLGLWRGAAQHQAAAGERQPPDPAWRRRALLAALLFVALAEPRLAEQRTRITLWVDDSLSMQTREAQGTRLAQGLAQARALLDGQAGAEAELRSLGEPWRSLGAPSDAVVATLQAGAGQREGAAPPAALLRRDRQHWLLTDGAHAAVLDWPADQQPDRVIRVGGATRNAGLQRLSARRNPSEPGRVDLLAKIVNGGDATESRELVLVGDAGELARSKHRIEPGGMALVSATIPLAASVRARLYPGDALAEDDTITLDLAALHKRRVATDARCPAALRAALSAHPALLPVPARDADPKTVQAVLDCGTTGMAATLPSLRVHSERTPAPPRAALRWSSALAESQHPPLDAQRLRVAAELPERPGDAVLLAAGDEALVVSRAGAARRLETSLDFEAMASASGPEVPLLVNWLFERLLGAPLLDQIVISERSPHASRVLPGERPRQASAAASTGAAIGKPGDAHPQRDGSAPLLVAALLVLLWEIAALGHQWRRLGGLAQDRSG